MDNQTITIDGIAYDMTQFSDEVKRSVAVYRVISEQMGGQRLELLKSEVTLNHVGNEITTKVKAELAAKAEAAANDAPAADETQAA
jgi:hypothetical protein